MTDSRGDSYKHFLTGDLPRFLEQVPIAICIRTADGDLRFINRKFEQTFGYTASEIFKLDKWLELGYPDRSYRERASAQWGRNFEAAIRSGGGQIPPGEYRITGKDGSIKDILLYGLITAEKDIVCMFEDITERAAREKAAKESEATLRRILDKAPMSMAIVNIDGTIEYINHKAEETFGYKHSDIPNMDRWWAQAYPDETYRKEVVPRWMGRVQEAFAKKSEIDGGEYLVTCKDGTRKTCFIFGVIAAGKVFVMFEDITQRVEALKAAQESENNLRRILDNAPMALGILGGAGKIEYLNSRFNQTFGYTIEDVPDFESWGRLAATDEQHRGEMTRQWLAEVEKASKAGGEIEAKEYTSRCKDGTVKSLLIRGVVIGGKTIVMFDDITRRVETEKALRENESRYRALIETTATGYVTINREGRVLDANREYVRLTGHKDLKEILGRNVLDWTAEYEKEKNAKAVAQCAAAGYIRNLEVDYVDKDGRTTPVEISATVVQSGKVPQILSICRDISSRRRTEGELKALNLELEKRVHARTAELTSANKELVTEIGQRVHAERAKEALQRELVQSQKMEAVGRLAGGIAHDFNNILVSISGYAELLMDTMPEGSPVRADLAEILLETQRGASLTRQLMTFSNRQALQLEELDLNALTAGAEKMLKRLIGANIRLETGLDAGLHRIKADASQITQIIMNLVINSRDAMPDGGRITIKTANVELGDAHSGMHLAPPPGSYVELSVSDTGCGMSAETQAYIFEPFYTTKPEGKGTGLGLSTLYGIVSGVKGGIAVNSAAGKGTTIKVYFPRAAQPLPPR